MSIDEGDRDKEIVKEKLPDFFIFQRHGSYQGLPVGDQQIDPNTLGHLTEKGVKEVEESADPEIRKILEYARSYGRKVNFFILNSPSALVDPKTAIEYGRRAEDTGKVVAVKITEVAEDYPEMEVNLIQFGKTVDGTRPTPQLQEPNYHYVEGSDNPRGYRVALDEKFGNQGRWENYHNIPADLEDLRLEVGAEGPQDIVSRAKFLIKALERYMETFGYKTGEEINVFWLPTHNDTLRSMIQYGFGEGDEARGYEPATGSIIELSVLDNQMTTEFQGKELVAAA